MVNLQKPREGTISKSTYRALGEEVLAVGTKGRGGIKGRRGGAPIVRTFDRRACCENPRCREI